MSSVVVPKGCRQNQFINAENQRGLGTIRSTRRSCCPRELTRLMPFSSARKEFSLPSTATQIVSPAAAPSILWCCGVSRETETARDLFAFSFTTIFFG
jgi:hypothetical protein